MLLENHKEDDAFMKYISSDDALFHYTRKETAIEKILLNNSLKFGTFSGTNDPQEYRPKLTGAVGWGWDDSSDFVPKAMHHLKVLSHRNSKFISFCTNTFKEGIFIDSGLLKSRMWAQYGDNHKGCCLILSKEKLIESLENQKKDHEILLSSNIKYLDPGRGKEPILHVNQSDFSKKSSEEIALDFFIKNKDRYLFRKQYDYRDECEFRVVSVNKKTSVANTYDLSVSIEKSLKGVVFGDRFPKLYAPTVNELLKNINVTPKHLAWHKTGYSLYDLT